MPEMTFLSGYNDDYRSVRHASMELEALMLYPNDSIERKKHVCHRHADDKLFQEEMSFLVHQSDDRPDLNLVEFKEQADALAERLKNNNLLPREEFYRGIRAGRQLHTIVGIESCGKHSSRNKAINLLGYYSLKTVSGKNLGTSKPSLDNAWSTHFTVAHLWAAKELLELIHEIPTSEFYGVEPLIPLLIPVAEWYRQMLITYHDNVKQTSYFDPNETWFPPGNFEYGNPADLKLSMFGNFPPDIARHLPK